MNSPDITRDSYLEMLQEDIVLSVENEMNLEEIIQTQDRPQTHYILLAPDFIDVGGLIGHHDLQTSH